MTDIMLPCLGSSTDEFPPVDSALREPNGLLAYGGDLSTNRLIQAYRRGIFPWYEEDQPLLWWSPDPRMVLLPGELHISQSLQRVLKRSNWKIGFNQHFEEVISACAAPRTYADGTWITNDMIEAYMRLHALGYAISVEVIDDSGALIGGLYGIAMGQVYFGESMFSSVSNASKVAFVHLVKQLDSMNYHLIDCQVSSEFLSSFGAKEISRSEFETFLPDVKSIPSPDLRWAEGI